MEFAAVQIREKGNGSRFELRVQEGLAQCNVTVMHSY